MNALLIGNSSVRFLDVLANKVRTPWEFTCIDDRTIGDGTKDSFRKADAIISISYDKAFPPAPNLRLLQAPGAGLEKIDLSSVPSATAICNAYGHEIPIAEYCVAGMLVLTHQILQIDKEFKAGDWLWTKQRKIPIHNEMFGKTVCVVGLGRIGQEICKRTRALGMRVVGCSRSRKHSIPQLTEVGTFSDLAHFVAHCDFLVLACALSEQTRGMINNKMVNLMSRDAILINVGRGPLVEESVLYEALRTHRIAGAVLDVWYQYPNESDHQPRPSKYPFHELENVIMTPHTSAWTNEMIDRRWSEIAQNLDNLFSGVPLINVVGPDRLYVSR